METSNQIFCYSDFHKLKSGRKDNRAGALIERPTIIIHADDHIDFLYTAHHYLSEAAKDSSLEDSRTTFLESHSPASTVESFGCLLEKLKVAPNVLLISDGIFKGSGNAKDLINSFSLD